MSDNQEQDGFDCERDCFCEGDLFLCPNVNALAEALVKFSQSPEEAETPDREPDTGTKT